MKIKFTKMQGAGNDFLVFDAIHQQIHFTPEQWKALADRRFGVGADQMLVVERSDIPEVDFRYRIYNADGGEVEHCGNGARAFVKFVHEKKLIKKKRIKVEIMKGIIEVNLEEDGTVTVDMNAPVLDAALVPFDSTGLKGKTEGLATLWPVEVGKKKIQLSVLSMGNPHAVQVVDDIELAPVIVQGALIEHHPQFPKRVNAGFMQVVDREHIRLRVYERGAGETLSCGTGACAAVVTGIKRGLLKDRVQVATKGGTLNIAWAGNGQPVMMTGPAINVFSGEISI